jgi:ankyrin repeat protein
MLIRKHDFHDYDGAKYLLELGVDPNGKWGTTSPFNHALMRDNHLAIITLLLDHGGDPQVVTNGINKRPHVQLGRAVVMYWTLIKTRGTSVYIGMVWTG